MNSKRVRWAALGAVAVAGPVLGLVGCELIASVDRADIPEPGTTTSVGGTGGTGGSTISASRAPEKRAESSFGGRAVGMTSRTRTQYIIAPKL